MAGSWLNQLNQPVLSDFNINIGFSITIKFFVENSSTHALLNKNHMIFSPKLFYAQIGRELCRWRGRRTILGAAGRNNSQQSSKTTPNMHEACIHPKIKRLPFSNKESFKSYLVFTAVTFGANRVNRASVTSQTKHKANLETWCDDRFHLAVLEENYLIFGRTRCVEGVCGLMNVRS